MNDLLFDLVYDYLDEIIDEQTWQAAVAEHGDELVQLLKEEQAVRDSIKTMPKQEMPAALREQLQQIPQQQTNTAKPNLLFPIFSSAAALAACLAITFIAIYTAGGTQSEFAPQSNEVSTVTDDMQKNAPEHEQRKASPDAFKSDQPLAEESMSTLDERIDRQKLPSKELALKDADKNFAPNKQMKRTEGAAAGADNLVEIEPLDDAAPAQVIAVAPAKKGAADESTPGAPEHARARRSAEAKQGGMRAEEKLMTGRKKSKAQGPQLAKSDMKAEAAVADGGMQGNFGDAAMAADQVAEAKPSVDTVELQDALDEARNNMKDNAKVREAVAKTKDKEVKSQEAILRGMIEANEELLGRAPAEEEADAEVAELAEVTAPQLDLQLKATAKAKHLDLQIGMNDVEHSWFRKAITDMKLIGYDAQKKIIWRSPIVTHELNEDIIELRSKDLPPTNVRSIVLESLNQQSKPISYPIK